MQFLEMEGKLGRRVDEVLLEDSGVRGGSGRDNLGDHRAPDRVREGFQHRLEPLGRHAVLLNLL